MSLCPQLCLLAFRALFENIRAPKRGRNANFQKLLKFPRNGVIKTLCAKNQVCKSIDVTCSTYRRFTKDKEENTRKWVKNQNFEKKMFRFLSQKLWPAAREQTDTQTDNGMDTEYPIRALAFQSFCLWYERSNYSCSYNIFSLKKECSVDLDLSSLSTSLQEWIRFAEDTNPVV